MAGTMTSGDARRRAIATEAADSETSAAFSIDVDVPRERAFRVFTEGIDRWWPRTHHIGAAEMALAVMEPRAGGRWYELGADGSTCEWGVVLEWEPPLHVALSWHLDGEFNYQGTSVAPSRVDVFFEPNADGGTRVSLIHSGLDAHGETWRLLRERIGRGWPTLLGLFRQVVDASVDTYVSSS
jgi:uncharacterized protein YndB with AHSA1/START domain